ncbi:MAG: hypothetical protein JW936_07150 [Sedimentisphaerales bacterium]|nr:hypothetical protein [Sedimentisphaerales bacterium]
MKKVLFVLLLMVIARPAVADVVTYPLSCAGTYNVNSEAWVHDFDLGVTFTEITQVSIQWSGAMTAATVSPPFQYIDVGVSASITGAAPQYRHASVWAGAEAYPVPEEFDCQSIIQSSGTTTDWSSLLDGQDQIRIEYTEEILLLQTYLHHGSMVLDDATLIVEGTVVPEPICATLLLIGATALLRKR